MILYVGLTQPVDRNTEERIEAKILEWFHKFRTKLKLVSVFPYDPVVMEYAVDIGEQPGESAAASLERWLAKLNLDESDLVVGNLSVLDSMSTEERAEHLTRKLSFLLDSVRQLGRGSANSSLRQIEYLLAGATAEAVDLLREDSALSVPSTPVEDNVSQILDEFWEKL